MATRSVKAWPVQTIYLTNKPKLFRVSLDNGGTWPLQTIYLTNDKPELFRVSLDNGGTTTTSVEAIRAELRNVMSQTSGIFPTLYDNVKKTGPKKKPRKK